MGELVDDVVASRPMSPTEKLFYKMQEYGGSTCGCIAEVYGELSEERLRAALARVVERSGLMRSRVELKDGWPQFVLHTNQDFPLVMLEDGDGERVDDLLAAGLETNFFERPFLWELTCLRDRADAHHYWLILVVNHAITDGTHIGVALTNLLLAYSETSAAREAPTTSIEPPLESYLKYNVSLTDGWRFLSLLARKQWLGLDSVKPEAIAQYPGRKTRAIHKQFSPELSARLRDKARQKSTTVNGALSAALAFAVAEKIDPKRRLRLGLETNVSFRKELGLRSDQAGALISMLSSIHTLEPERQFWALARETKHAVVTAQEKNMHRVNNHMWEWLQRWMSDAARMKYLNGDKLGRLELMLISNMGDLGIPRELSGFRLESLRMLASQHGFGNFFSMTAVSLGGRLGLNLSFAEPVVQRATAQSVLAAIADLVERAVALDDFSLAEWTARDGAPARRPQPQAAAPQPDQHVA